jgi:predicted nucleic acid-binding protein
VLDNSVNSRLICPAPDRTVNDYALSVLQQAQNGIVFKVPSIWPYEVANVCAGLERREVISRALVERYFANLGKLPIEVDVESHVECYARTYAISVSHGLSIYDAAYLELALREAAPLATNDEQLSKVAEKLGVPLYLP